MLDIAVFDTSNLPNKKQNYHKPQNSNNSARFGSPRSSLNISGVNRNDPDLSIVISDGVDSREPSLPSIANNIGLSSNHSSNYNIHETRLDNNVSTNLDFPISEPPPTIRNVSDTHSLSQLQAGSAGTHFTVDPQTGLPIAFASINAPKSPDIGIDSYIHHLHPSLDDNSNHIEIEFSFGNLTKHGQKSLARFVSHQSVFSGASGAISNMRAQMSNSNITNTKSASQPLYDVRLNANKSIEMTIIAPQHSSMEESANAKRNSWEKSVGLKAPSIKKTKTIPVSNDADIKSLDEDLEIRNKMHELIVEITQTMDEEKDIIMVFVHGVNTTNDGLSKMYFFSLFFCCHDHCLFVYVSFVSRFKVFFVCVCHFWSVKVKQKCYELFVCNTEV